jgi:hypothetical protein
LRIKLLQGFYSKEEYMKQKKHHPLFESFKNLVTTKTSEAMETFNLQLTKFIKQNTGIRNNETFVDSKLDNLTSVVLEDLISPYKELTLVEAPEEEIKRKFFTIIKNAIYRTLGNENPIEKSFKDKIKKLLKKQIDKGVLTPKKVSRVKSLYYKTNTLEHKEEYNHKKDFFEIKKFIEPLTRDCIKVDYGNIDGEERQRVHYSPVLEKVFEKFFQSDFCDKYYWSPKELTKLFSWIIKAAQYLYKKNNPEEKFNFFISDLHFTSIDSKDFNHENDWATNAKIENEINQRQNFNHFESIIDKDGVDQAETQKWLERCTFLFETTFQKEKNRQAIVTTWFHSLIFNRVLEKFLPEESVELKELLTAKFKELKQEKNLTPTQFTALILNISAGSVSNYRKAMESFIGRCFDKHDNFTKAEIESNYNLICDLMLKFNQRLYQNYNKEIRGVN